MLLPGSYANGFAPRDGRPLYPSLWKSCVGAWNPGLGVTGLTTLRDQSGYQNTGTLTNGPTWAASGGKYSLDLDGNEYADCGNDSSLTFGSGVSCSCSLWMWQRTAQAGWRGFVYHDNAGKSQGHIGLQASTRYLAAGTGDGSTWRTQVTTWVPSTQVWYHVAWTLNRETNTLKIYANSDEVGSFAHSFVPSAPSLPLRIGSGLINGTENFDGRIDSVLRYRRVLSPQEIRTLATRRGIAYEMAPRRRAQEQDTANRRRRFLLGAQT